MNPELQPQYAMNGLVDIVNFNVSLESNRKYFHYPFEMVEKFVTKAKFRDIMHYPETDGWLYQAIEKHSIKDKNILIIGSEEPCYEGVAIHFGANVTMVEYQKVTSDHPSLKTLTVPEFEKEEKEYDAAISISSVEHSGLGRYGDELDPDGDLKSMETLYKSMKTGGLCFLAVPIGVDQILWNAHRVYGKNRFPLLTKGWTIIDSFGFEEIDFTIDEADRRRRGKVPGRNGTSGGAHQPVFVLQK